MNFMSRSEVTEAVRRAAARTLRSIRRHHEKAPARLKPLFAHLEENLLRESLNSKTAYASSGTPEHLSLEFARIAGKTVKPYYDSRRIEIAKRLLIHTDIDPREIAAQLGYDYRTFERNLAKLNEGARPEDIRLGRKEGDLWRAPPDSGDAVLELGRRGELDDSTSAGYLDESLRRNPCLRKEIERRGRAAEAQESLIVVDGKSFERIFAEDYLRRIEGLPFAEQKRQIRRLDFRSRTLFDLLLERSRIEGRKKRQRGIEVAELAVVSLERGDAVFGEKIHDLRALGWAWLGNAYRLARDFFSADAAFRKADDEWCVPRTAPDEMVLAEICNLRGALKLLQREYDAGLRLLNQACALFEQEGAGVEQARALAQRALINGYANRPEDAVADLRRAEKILEELEEPYLAFVITGDLAIALSKAGKSRAASETLREAKRIWRDLDYPLGAHEIEWISGDIEEGLGDLRAAESCFRRARSGFAKAQDLNRFARTSVDLMLVQAAQGQNVMPLASETVPVLESLHLHEETLAAVGLLVQAVGLEEVSPQVVRRVRDCLREDPLAALPLQQGAGLELPAP